METRILDLLELQNVLKRGIEGTVPSKVWVRAEIAALKSKNGGHCYIDLAQNDDNGLVAKAQATVWANRFRILGPYFETETGMPLQAGIKVLLLVQVTYHPVYGLSLNVDNIDPAYTLGERERVRRETIQRLEAEGLMDMQKSLPEVELPRRVAVVSASDAAGFGDFMKHLGENPYGFTFNVTLFPALMQGVGCPDSIISAFEDILLAGGEEGKGADEGADGAVGKGFDVVFIMRGGGSELDLACFDDYGLCKGIAQFPLPVFTAIGHEKDYHIADMVAHGYAKTPTALADMLVDWYADADAQLSSYASRLRLAFSSKISAMEKDVTKLETKINIALRDKFTQMERHIIKLENKIHNGFKTKIASMDKNLTILESKIRASLRTKISGMENHIRILEGRVNSAVKSLKTRISSMESDLTSIQRSLRSAFKSKLSLMEGQLNVLEMKIREADPRKIITRGYILAVDEAGLAVKSVAGRSVGEKISMMLADGTLDCTIDKIKQD